MSRCGLEPEHYFDHEDFMAIFEMCIRDSNKWWAAKKKQPTKAVVSALLKDGRVRVTGLYSEKIGKTYDATVVLEDDGQYANFKLEFDQRKGGSR